MKIAMFGHNRIPSREGGVEIVVEELSTRMAALGHQVTCYNLCGRPVLGEESDGRRLNMWRGVRLNWVRTMDKKRLAVVSSSFFATLRSAFSDADVVHIHGEGPAFMCWLPRLMGKKVVVTIHGLDWQREKWKGGFGSKYIRAGEKMAVRFAHEIIVPSRSMQQYFTDTYGRRTVSIPNGVDRPMVRPAQQICQDFGLQKDGYILFLGRLVPEKGVHYLIDAYKTLHTDKKLVIAGGASDTDDYVKRLHEMAVGNLNIVFTGFVQGQLLEELYSNAWVYVLPSDVEGMPISLLEAMSYGNCCLTSNIPECAEAVESFAARFVQGDVGSLAAVLQQLCDAPAIVNWYRASAADFVCNKYNWDKATERILELYV